MPETPDPNETSEMKLSGELGLPPRFGQLTYSSFDRGVGFDGGWQVKQTAGALTADEQQLLRSRIVTHFDPIAALPQFPSPEEVRDLPRRLMYSSVPLGAAYWHTVPAGVDGSGRPGNVFAHVILDRLPSEALPALRPIDLWRSPDWLTPFGPQEVLQAELPDTARGSWDIPRPGIGVNRAKVLDFLFDAEVWRFDVLALLLDAVSEALEGGPRVVLAVDGGEAAALWFGAVSHVMSAGSSRRLFFSTYEHASTLAVAFSAGALLVAIPLGEVELLRSDGTFVLILENEPPPLPGQPEPPDRLARGALAPKTAWSSVVGASMLYRGLAERALEMQDIIAESWGDHDLHPSWPLAMAATEIGGELDDARDAAATILRDWTPLRLIDPSPLPPAGIPQPPDDHLRAPEESAPSRN